MIDGLVPDAIAVMPAPQELGEQWPVEIAMTQHARSKRGGGLASKLCDLVYASYRWSEGVKVLVPVVA